MKSKKGFTLIELMVVVLIVAILAAVAIPILRGRIDAAKWSEGKAMMGTIATAIRAWNAEQGGTTAITLSVANLFDADVLGFATGDLTGTYFADADFTPLVAVYTPGAAVTFTITCTPLTDADRPSAPSGYTLDNTGVFTAQ